MRMFSEDAIAIATIRAEAQSEPRSGQVAVGEVIRNRTEQRYASSGTIASTVLRRKQFSCWNDSTPWREGILDLDYDDPTVAEAKAAWTIVKEQRSDTVKGAVLYHTVARPAGVSVWPPSWALQPTVKLVATINAHRFYTDGK